MVFNYQLMDIYFLFHFLCFEYFSVHKYKMIKLPSRYIYRKLTLSSLARITNSTKDHAIAAQVAEQNFVDGRRCIPTDHKNSQVVDNINPATGKVIGQLYHSGKEEVDRSIKNSKEAFASWSSTSASERSSILRRAGKRIRQNIHEIAKLETLDSGIFPYSGLYLFIVQQMNTTSDAENTSQFFFWFLTVLVC